MKKDGVSTLKVAGAYIGTVVGAGFATGQEIFQFFSRFAAMGLLGLIFCAIMFVLFGYIIMRLGKQLHTRSHMEIIRYAGGRILGTIADIIITFFLFGTLTAMIAGTGALVHQEFQMPEIIGSLLMAILTAITVLTGINGVIKAISFIVPFLLLAVTGTSIYSIVTAPPDLTATVSAAGGSGLITNWFLAAVLYVSYNTIISIAVLGPLGVQAQNYKAIRNGAILGGIGLGLGSIMIYLALAGHLESVSSLEVPMIFIAGWISSPMKFIYAIVLIAAIYTTAVGSLYGFTSRISEIVKFDGKWIIMVTTLFALVASRFGFSNLVKYLYPAVGYGGIILLVSLLYIELKHKRTARRSL